MITRRITVWFCFLPAIGLAMAFVSPAFGQGEEAEAEPSAAGRVGGVFQRFFAPRESQETEKSSATPRSSPTRGFKPGTFQGGFVKQLKAIADPNPESEVTVERTPTTQSQRQAAVPMTPSQMAQRSSPREPFSSPAPNNPPVVRKPSSTTPSRDVFAEDPPSLVGTGVNPRRMSTQQPATGTLRSSEPPVTTRDVPKSTSSSVASKQTNADESLAKSPASTRNKAVADEEELEIPRVSRKTVPVASASTPVTAPNTLAPAATSATKSVAPPPNTSYAIPSNPYTAPPSEANRYAPTNNGVSAGNKPLPNNAPSTTSTAASKPSAPVANSSPSNPSNVANASRGETRAEMSIPKVKLFVSGPPSLQVGRSVPYEVLVRNEGNELLSGVIVSMVVPASVKSSLPVATAGEFDSEKDAQGVETLLWHVTDLAPTQARVFRVNLEATKPEHFAVDVEWTVLPQTGKIEVAVQQPQLNLSLEGPSQVLWGKPEVYRLRVRNPGNADVKDVQVKLAAESYGSNQSKIGDVPAGGEKVVEVELTFQQSGMIKLSGAAESSTQALQADAAIEVAVEQIDLAVEWNGPSEQFMGSVTEHAVVVTNRSRIAADNVNCSATIPSGFKVVSMPSGASINGSQVTWTAARLNPNAPQAFDFALQALDAGDTKLLSNVTSSGGGKASTELAVKVESISDLKLTVTDPIAPAPVGQDVVYDLTIVNRGSKAANAVQILAQFSNGIEPIRAEGSVGRILPGQVVFEPIPTIAPGQQITLRVVAQASEPGMHRFRAELQCEEGDTQLVEEESTRYLATTKVDPNRSTIRR